MEEKKVKGITSRDENFADWYTDICRVADLIDYSSVKGCMIIRPLGYAIWENIQSVANEKFKETGHENVYMPMFIPESLLNVEKEHVEGFAPEVAWVTHGGDKKLEERLCVRPTSETLFCDHYKKIIKSYRDLPKLYNQWCSVVRWEATTRPFLRSREFLWQEGHTMHATAKEAIEETKKMLDIYADICEKYLAMPVIKGRKTEKEKFSGAEATYTVEAMMYNGIALQAGTSHYFGNHFASAFDIKYLDQNNKLITPFQTSWGISTRLIGGMIMVHADDNGLVLPPNIAPTKVIIISIGQDEKVNEVQTKITEELKLNNISYKIDCSDKTPGFKFADAETKGYPIRIEIGKRDLEENMVTLVRRDTLEHIKVNYEDTTTKIKELLIEIQDNLYNQALKRRNEKMYEVNTYEELKDFAENKNGFVKTYFCNDPECEDNIKNDTGLTTRCILETDSKTGKCIRCGKEGYPIYFGKQY